MTATLDAELTMGRLDALEFLYAEQQETIRFLLHWIDLEEHKHDCKPPQTPYNRLFSESKGNPTLQRRED